jgi:peptidoglycan/xylan/chitin deacetylase (PgdA/CDA1 family)
MSFLGRAAVALADRCRRAGVVINEHTLTRDQTRRHITALGRQFDFIGLDELPSRLESRRERPFCLMTFDDGKRGNATESAAELERAGVPAVFYVVTEFLTHGRPLWFDRYRALIRRLGTAPRGLEQNAVKRLPFDVLTERLDRACDRYGVEADMQSDEVGPMTWDDARSLGQRGFVIGAHSRNHAILTLEPEDVAINNIQGSMADVTREVGVCSTFAFPNGNYTPELALLARAAGATTVMTTDPRWVDAYGSLWCLPRVQLFGPHSAGRIELKLAAAAVGRVLANPNGTGRRYSGRM